MDHELVNVGHTSGGNCYTCSHTVGARGTVRVASGTVRPHSRRAAVFTVADSGSAVARRYATALLKGIEGIGGRVGGCHRSERQGQEGEEVLDGDHGEVELKISKLSF